MTLTCHKDGCQKNQVKQKHFSIASPRSGFAVGQRRSQQLKSGLGEEHGAAKSKARAVLMTGGTVVVILAGRTRYGWRGKGQLLLQLLLLLPWFIPEYEHGGSINC